MSRGAKWLVLSSAAVLFLGTVSAVFYALWPYVYSGDIDRELARLKAAGKPVSVTDLVPPAIPASENAAFVYDKAFALLPRNAPSAYLGGGVRNWFAPRDSDYWRRTRIDVDAASGALAVAEKAARMPRCVFAAGWERSQQTPTQHMQRLRTLCRLFAARAALYARDGRMGDAFKDLETIILAGRSLRDEPSMVSALSQAAIAGTAARALAECLSYGTLTVQQARKLYDLFGSVKLKRSFVRALEGERAVQLDVLDSIQRRAIPDSSTVGGEIHAVLRRWTGSPLLRAQIKMEKRVFLREMDALISAADLSYRDYIISGSRRRQDGLRARRAVIAGSLVPSFDRSRAARDRGIASAAGSRIALALEAHRSKTGSYPDSLEALESVPGWRIEKDPFSGGDFVYKKLPNGFLLYSIGEDFRDDGGSPDANPRQRSSGSFGRRGDIVWRVER